MKKLRRFLPVLILILALIVLFAPSGNNNGVAPVTTTASPSPAGSDGDLLLLQPQPEGDASGTPSPVSEPEQNVQTEDPAPEEEEPLIPEDGSYTTKEDVALYLNTYGHLPENFVTKKEAEKAGWSGGSLEYAMPGKCIGGDRFGNRENQLPKAKGRIWWECDINTLGQRSRGAERLVYSSDGLIYYTPDHYETFVRLY